MLGNLIARAQGITGGLLSSGTRLGRIVLAAACLLLVAPAVAQADLTITSASDNNLSESGCSFTATSADAVLNVSELNTCLAGSGSATVTDSQSGSAVTISSPISGGTTSTLTINAGGGNLSQGSSAGITVGTFDASSAGDVDLDFATTNAIATFSANAADDANLNDSASSLRLGDSSVGGTFTINAAGPITQTGSVSANSLAAISTATNGSSVTLTDAANSIADFAAEGVTDVSFDDISAVTIEHLSASGDATITSQGPITQGPTPIFVTGTLTTSSVGGTAIGGGNSNLADFSATNSGGGAISAQMAPGDALNLGTVTNPGGPVTVQAAGGITQSGPLTANDVTLDENPGTSISLTDPGNDFSSLSATGIPTIDDASSGGLDITGIANEGLASLTNAGPLTVSGAIGSLGQFEVNLSSTSGPVTETGPGTITASDLDATATDGISLTGGGNQVGTFAADDSGSGDIALVDGTNLTVGSVAGTNGISGPGDVALTLSGAGASLVNSAAITARSVSLTADQMSLSGGSIHAPNIVSLTPETSGRPISLGATAPGDLSLLASDLNTVTANQLSVGDAGVGPITVSGAISPPVETLSLSGPDGITGSGAGSLAAPAVAFVNSGPASRTWTVGPTSVSDGSGTALPYSATTLEILGGSAGDTFAATPSANTTYSLDGGPAFDGALTYDAQNRVVSGSTSPPAGVIDAAGVKPVQFTGMQSVSILNPGSAPPATTTNSPPATTTNSPPSTTAPPPPTTSSPPKCSIAKAKLALAKKKAKHAKATPSGVVVTMRCNQTVTAALTGSIVQKLKIRTRQGRVRTKTTRMKLRTIHFSLSSGAVRQQLVALRSSLVTALRKGAHDSASFTLVVSDGNGRDQTTLKLTRL
ncbi:MAG TPA: hypothetical protein VMD09_07895 [Solirubrobacteraceae bacterium]|nr:hypothetical protein [Solirubrobacteraceae bacterium]